MKSVPKLELPEIEFTMSDNDDIGNNLDVMPKLHIRYDSQSNIPQVYTDGDLEKMYKLYKAKKSLSSRKNIEYIMDADVLLAISKISHDEEVHLRITFEPIEKEQIQNDKEIKKKHLSIHITPNTSPQISPKSSPKNSGRNSGKNSPKGTQKSDLSKSESSITDSSNEETQRKTRNRVVSSTDKKPFTLLMANNVLIKKPRKNIINSGIIYTIFYELSDVNYSIFVIEKINDEIICKGITETGIKSFVISNFKPVYFNYNFLEKNVAITAYMDDATNFSCPIYFCLSNDNVECKIEEFMNIVEEITKLAQLEHKNKKQQ